MSSFSLPTKKNAAANAFSTIISAVANDLNLKLSSKVKIGALPVSTFDQVIADLKTKGWNASIVTVAEPWLGANGIGGGTVQVNYLVVN